MITRLVNKLVVPVVDKTGHKIDEREFVNCPFAELYQGEDIIIIDWLGSTRERPTLDELNTPITYNGKKFYGTFAWGSAVKMGQTIGLTHDIGHETGLVKYAEDGVRLQRQWLAKGYFGGFVADKLKVMIVPNGTVLECGPVSDGFGYISRKLVDETCTKLPAIKLGNAKENYTFWQRIEWDKVKDEQTPLIQERINNAASLENMLYAAPHSFAQKKELCELDQLMLEHPFVANALARTSGEWYARLSTCGVTNGVYRVVVPSTQRFCWPGHSGKMGFYRSPIDSNGSIQAVDMQACDSESERIANMEVIQYTLASTSFGAKGDSGISNKLPAGYDLVLCADDIKITTGDVATLRKLHELEIDSAVMAFTQRWAPGSAIGLDADFYKDLMGVDCDGDGMVAFDLNEMPALYKAIKELEPGDTPKLTKTKTPIGRDDKRPEMIMKSMMNIVGFATNVMSTIKMFKNQGYVARVLGFKSVAAMDKYLNYAIKCGTDGFKTDVDMVLIEKQLAVLQANISKQLGGMAPYGGWPNGIAFKNFVPQCIDHIEYQKGMPKDERIVHIEGDGFEIYNTDEIAECIKKSQDGTVPEICRMTLPTIKYQMGEPISVHPLSMYRTWAVRPRNTDAALKFQDFFNARAHRVNYSDVDDILSFKRDIDEEIAKWVGNGDRMKAAQELWYVAHSSRSVDASAASVFMAFPDECKIIVAEKPGDAAPKLEVILTGCGYQVPSLETVKLAVEVITVRIESSKKLVVRKAVVGKIEGQIQPALPYPENMIGLIAKNSDQPNDGKYTAKIERISDGAWKCVLA